MTDPFELFGLPESFHVDQKELRTAYLKAIKAHHPDRYLHDHQAHERALEVSSNIHAAYQLLSHPLEVTGYLLKKKGMLDEKESLPQDFLFEMMDLNEQLDDLEDQKDPIQAENLHNELERWENDLYKIFQQNSDNQNVDDVNRLGHIKDSYLKLKYILRLKDRLVNFASR